MTHNRFVLRVYAVIYSGFARSCIAKTTDNNVENEYIVTDENGCATDPSIFGEWDCDPDTGALMAEFNAFKFPSSDNIRFQCNIRVCFGKCQPVRDIFYDKTYVLQHYRKVLRFRKYRS